LLLLAFKDGCSGEGGKQVYNNIVHPIFIQTRESDGSRVGQGAVAGKEGGNGVGGRMREGLVVDLGK